MGHLNTRFDPGDGNLNNPNFKSSNAQGVAGGGGMLKFPFDRYITMLPIYNFEFTDNKMRRCILFEKLKRNCKLNSSLK